MRNTSVRTIVFSILLAAAALPATHAMAGSSQLVRTQLKIVAPTSGYLNSDFNERPCGTSYTHRGFDIPNSTDTEIYSSFSGEVVAKYTDEHPTWGRYLVVRHQPLDEANSTKWETLYAHLNGFASGISVGTSVRRGQLVAYMGNTGNSSGTHLHFALAKKDSDSTESIIVFSSTYLTDLNDSAYRCPTNSIVALTEISDTLSNLWNHNWWYLRNANSAGNADTFFSYGRTSDVPVAGDWDGDGSVTPGVVRGNLWILNNGFDSTFDFQFSFGSSSDIPVVGDWDDDGDDTPGVFRPSDNKHWFLNNGFDGVSEDDCYFGSTGDLAITGDWDGDGGDGIGVYRPSTKHWYLNDGCDVTAEDDVAFGSTGDIPVVGDWDGSGGTVGDNIGVNRPSSSNPLIATWILDDDNDGSADLVFDYGYSLDTPFAGDWDDSSSDTIGIGRGRVEDS